MKPILRQIRFPITAGKEWIEPDKQKVIYIDGMVISILNVSQEKKAISFDKRLKSWDY